MMQRTFQNRYS